MYDQGLSRIVVELCVSIAMRKKLTTKFSHIDDFDIFHGKVYVIMILQTCHASASLDIKGVEELFRKLRLSNLPGENVSRLAIAALKFITMMNTEYIMDIKSDINY